MVTKSTKNDLQLLQALAHTEAKLRADLAALQTKIALGQKAQREALARERDRVSLTLGHVAFDAGLHTLATSLWEEVCQALCALRQDQISWNEWLKYWREKTDVSS